MNSVDFDWPIWMEYNSMKLNGQCWFWLINLNGIKFYEVKWTVLNLIDQFEGGNEEIRFDIICEFHAERSGRKNAKYLLKY